MLGELEKTNKRIEKLNEIIRSIQKDLKKYFDCETEEDKQKLKDLKSELQRIACAKDLDVIYAMFKPDLDPEKLEENKEEEETEDSASNKTRDDTITTSKTHLTQTSIDDTANTSSLSSVSTPNLNDPAQLAQIQENAMKVLKQHLEIVKLKEELESISKEKEDLEEEISSRNKEIYEMNEKIILMEMNHASARQQDLNTIQDLKDALDRQGKTERAVYNFSKFKDSLDRLKCDLELLKLSEKFAKNRNKKHFVDSSKEEQQNEAFLGDSLTDAKKESNLEDSGSSSKNLSSDKLVLDNIQRSIELIQLIQEEIEDQEKMVVDKEIDSATKKKKNEHHDTENTTTIMQDIDIINGAVSENVVANHEDSFLNSMCSDVNISKFDENAVKYSVSASILEEKENKIRELKQIIEAQNKNLTLLTRSHHELKTENSKLQKSLDDRNESKSQDEGSSQSDEAPKSQRLRQSKTVGPESEVKRLEDKISRLEKEYQSEREHHLEIINNDTLKNDYYALENNFNELKSAKDKIYKELVQSREKVDKQEKELREKDERISELEHQALALEKAANQSKQQLSNMMTGMPMQPMGPMMGGYMVPENMHGGLHFTSYNQLNQNNMAPQMNQPSVGHLNISDEHSSFENQPTQMKQAPPPSFFANKVVKPIRGGGKKKQEPVVGANPYNNSEPYNNEFNNVARKTVKHLGGASDKMFYKPPPTANPFTPLVRPDQETQDGENFKKQKSFKQLRRESKKHNYLSKLNFLKLGFDKVND